MMRRKAAANLSCFQSKILFICVCLSQFLILSFRSSMSSHFVCCAVQYIPYTIRIDYT